MATVYVYADETGNLDYNSLSSPTESPYFGIGTATYTGDHGAALMDGLNLRAKMAARGDNFASGFHAKDDSRLTRAEVAALIARQAPRFDVTVLCKPRAYPRVRERGQMYLYKMGLYLHCKEIIPRVSQPGDEVFLIAGTFGTKKRQQQATEALQDVCKQVRRNVSLCVWESRSSWGLQVADYGTWAVQRNLMGKDVPWYTTSVKPTLQTCFFPWGRNE